MSKILKRLADIELDRTCKEEFDLDVALELIQADLHPGQLAFVDDTTTLNEAWNNFKQTFFY